MSGFPPTTLVLLQRVCEHVEAAGEIVERCHRAIEHVYKLSDPHPQVTVAHVYARLGVAVARMQTAHEQLRILLEWRPDLPSAPGRE